MQVLMPAWHAIRRNAETSKSKATREGAREFGAALPMQIRRIQERLRAGYRFDPAYGATPRKGGGKSGKRPLVIATLQDRIVQRAILDVLQDARELQGVQAVLATPTSFGGIKGRGVDDAIRLFDQQVQAGHRYVAGSDISGFFTKVKPSALLDVLRSDAVAEPFVGLVGKALTVELSNLDDLDPADRKLFPNGDDGVAQGCPLSALAGNVALAAFDRQMNAPDRHVTCIRYIDDFIITGRTEKQVRKAMQSAKRMLEDLGMSIYDPEKSPAKAFAGPIGGSHVFLGCELKPGEYAPCRAAQDRLLQSIDTILRAGKKSIRKAIRGDRLSTTDACFAQTLVQVDRVIHGWRSSFRMSSAPAVFAALDRTIDGRLNAFEMAFRQSLREQPPVARRRALGVRSIELGPV